MNILSCVSLIHINKIFKASCFLYRQHLETWKAFLNYPRHIRPVLMAGWANPTARLLTALASSQQPGSTQEINSSIQKLAPIPISRSLPFPVL